jgi:hypothetical protein
VFPDGDPNAGELASKAIGSYFLLLNSLIPLALVVLLELVKVFFTMVVEADSEMAYEDHYIKEVRYCSV